MDIHVEPSGPVDRLGWRFDPPPPPGKDDSLAMSPLISRLHVMFGDPELMQHLQTNFILARENVGPISFTDKKWFTNSQAGVAAGNVLVELQALHRLAERGIATIGQFVAARAAHGALSIQSLHMLMTKSSYSVPCRMTMNTWPTCNGMCQPTVLAYSILHAGLNNWKGAQILRHAHFNNPIQMCWFLTLCAIGEAWKRRSYEPLADSSELEALPFLDRSGRHLLGPDTPPAELRVYPVSVDHDNSSDNMTDSNGNVITTMVFASTEQQILITRISDETLPIYGAAQQLASAKAHPNTNAG